MTDECIFCKIVNKIVPKEFTYETNGVVVFDDIKPVAPIHLLILPKKHIQEFYNLKSEDQKIWEEMLNVVRKMIERYGLIKKGYRVVTNGGGAQAIDHFHIHLMGEINKNREL